MTGFSEQGLTKYNSGITDFEVPDKVKGTDVEDYTITEIGGFAYKGNLTNMKLPNTIKMIGNEAFYNCKKLLLVK